MNDPDIIDSFVVKTNSYIDQMCFSLNSSLGMNLSLLISFNQTSYLNEVRLTFEDNNLLTQRSLANSKLKSYGDDIRISLNESNTIHVHYGNQAGHICGR